MVSRVPCGLRRSLDFRAHHFLCLLLPMPGFPLSGGKVDHLARLSPSAFTEREGGNDRLFYLSFLSSSQKCVTFYDEEIA